MAAVETLAGFLLLTFGELFAYAAAMIFAFYVALQIVNILVNALSREVGQRCPHIS